MRAAIYPEIITVCFHPLDVISDGIHGLYDI